MESYKDITDINRALMIGYFKVGGQVLLAPIKLVGGTVISVVESPFHLFPGLGESFLGARLLVETFTDIGDACNDLQPVLRTKKAYEQNRERVRQNLEK